MTKNKHIQQLSNAIWAITGRCNYNCRHCSVSAPIGSMGEMSFLQCKDVIRQLKECNIKSVVLIGGEPLIHPEFKKIIDALCEKEIQISSIFTNCSLLNEEILDFFKSRNIKPAITTSYDGVGFHDKMRGVPGAENDLYRAFELLQRNGWEVTCEMSLTKESICSLNESIKILVKYGVKSAVIYPPMNYGNWLKVDKSEKLDVKDMADYFNGFLTDFIAEDLPISIKLYPLFLYDYKSKGFAFMPNTFCSAETQQTTLSCRNFETSFCISPSGHIVPCFTMLDTDFANKKMPCLFDTPLKSLLKDSEFAHCRECTVSYILEHNDECKNCKYKYICGGGCRNEALSETGDFYGKAPKLCKVFKDGYYEKLEKAILKGYARRLFH